jgi:hypothetical protein
MGNANNILTAIHTIAISQNVTLPNVESDINNRINQIGDPLEVYIKDAFAGVLGESDSKTRLDKYSNCYSWAGNKNNPPDFILKGGDAVEVKKISGTRGTIQLNSSYPKQRLFSSDPMITQACRDSEDWVEKDLLYVIGHVKNKTQLQSLWMVYGDCFVATSEVYTKVADAVRDGVLQSGLHLNTKTKELARVNQVDPLGITSLRVRGMWIIANPAQLFADLVPKSSTNITINSIMSETKFLSFPEYDRQILGNLSKDTFESHSINIPLPDNPAKPKKQFL